MMFSVRKTDPRGVEAAQRPQLPPVLTLERFSVHLQVSHLFPSSVISCVGFSIPETFRRVDPCSPSRDRPRRENNTWISYLTAALKFESIRTKSSMNSFTNHLGRVYHVRIINNKTLYFFFANFSVPDAVGGELPGGRVAAVIKKP